ncbi:MAG: tRNA uridine-5-carboxymethylaminomethyl(34) synthesis GTPase MnmE [Deltaproteobacteria bacterium]|nr:tRNA uridine-5-carboxymethylaminomethyl(34) synthesis GTPase MnmE [Deltaproteobacteria bacterium]
MESSTIAAISTPPGTGGIGIIKISGPLTLSIGEKIFHKKGLFKHAIDNKPARHSSGFSLQSHRFYYGHIIEPDTHHLIDEVLIVLMKAPGSYTREDVLEIHSHGGYAVLQAIMNLVLSCGAELAQPGEFTRRAFLNGRIDLTQAEAVMDIINAKSRDALDIAAAQINGALKDNILTARSELLKSQALCEAVIDFSEDMDEEYEINDILSQMQTRIQEPLKELILNYECGHVMREGIKIVIIGKPNVGKSSLMNRLLDKERVLVTNIPGTTRDMIEEALNIHGIAVILTDTAGLHHTNDPVEAMGIKKTDEYIENADLVVFMIDASGPPDENDARIYTQIKHKKHIVVRNKIDVVNRETPDTKQWKDKKAINISVLKNVGIKELKRTISQAAVTDAAVETCHKIVPNLRQKKIIEKTITHVTDAILGIKKGVFLDLVVLDIKDAIENLNQVLGISMRDDVQATIFDQFCIGK